jgi:ubiquitin carboxyl-terminal hydrolase 36/42
MILFMESLVNACFQIAKPPREFIYKNQNKTSVFQLIGGKSRSQVLCLGCNHQSNTYEDLISLSLEFPKNRQMGGVTLEQCMNNFYSVEHLKGDNKYMCSGCKKRCEAKKRFSIETAPRTLIVHLKRFTNFGNKILEIVRYPATLTLDNYMSKNVDSQIKTLSMSEETYDLYGVVVHQGGGCRSGHYFSYCKSFDNEWY